jgi:DNA repair protein RadD
MTLRPYQQTALTDARQAYRDGARRVLMVAPTGAGKTVIAATAIAAQQQRAAASSSSRRAARLWRRPRPS